jgi:hypothetical protein
MHNCSDVLYIKPKTNTRFLHTNTTNAKEYSTERRLPAKTTRHLNVQTHSENELNNACNKDFCK